MASQGTLVDRLGGLSRSYHFNTLRMRQGLFPALFLIVMGLVAGGIIIIAVFKNAHYASSEILATSIITLGVLSIISVGAGEIALLRQSLGRRVDVYRDGFTVTKGHYALVFRWDDITTVRQKITKYSGVTNIKTHRYRIQRSDGAAIVLNDFTWEVEQLGDTIQQETYKILFPRALAVYEAGQEIAFGFWHISKSGLKGRKLIPWHELKPATIDQNYIFIQKQHGWPSIAIATSRTPNAFVLIALLDRIIGVRRAK